MSERSFARLKRIPDASEHVINVANFLAWFDPDHVQGGIKAEQAFESFCALLNIPRGRLMNIVRGRPQAEEPVDGSR